mmetsp:Transcript_43192/g.119462  ORF Transcript_43192/g.119462 Transcript_43192/m.119462 type:complete len:189 (+) Transcript_43192:33-599(+)
MIAPVAKLLRAVQERGWKGALIQLYTIGDLKFGQLKGTDSRGNKYYENIELPYGQHRWVEYANIHDYDASMIPPEWHGWMHHTYDETPNDAQFTLPTLDTVDVTHATLHYATHVGRTNPVEHAEEQQTDLSQYRQRGYKIGSLMSGPEDEEKYYKQPGHPLSPKADKGGRFQNLKNIHVWTPEGMERK